MPPTAADRVHRERAPAKINLDLLVTGRRDGGLHELDSLVVFGLVEDRLELTPAPDFELVVEGPFAAAVPHGEANLVLRAARDLDTAVGLPGGARIRLVKNIPVAAGLGGGSADAAACMRGLAALYGLDLDLVDLVEIAAALGADVPVCLYARPARIRGVGERIDPVRSLPVLPLLLVNPRVPVETGPVFRALKIGSGSAARQPLPAAATLPIFGAWLAEGRNDLEPAARALAPIVDEVLELLRAQEDCLVARMSGSGATCFALFGREVSLRQAAARVSAARPEWWIAQGLVEDAP